MVTLIASHLARTLIVLGSMLILAPLAAQTTVAIDGLEVTQATQHYKSSQHLRDATDYGQDNNIPLIEGKTTYVRTYLRRPSGPAAEMVGTLTVERQTGAEWTLVTTVESAQPLTPEVEPSYTASRGDAARTLNFVVPGSIVQGALRFTAKVRQSGTAAVLAESQVAVPAAFRRTLRLAAVTVGYHGPSGGTVITAPAPGDDVVRTVAAHAIAAMPVSDTGEFRVVGTITQTEPLLFGTVSATNVGASRLFACPATWTRLMKRVREIRRADGPQPGWLYYGLLANEIPYAGNTTGCGGGGVGTGKVERPATMTHELGHAAGQPHIPGINDRCTGDGAVASYPRYRTQPSGAYPRGSIGEFGFDTRSGTVRRPEQISDIMQYCTDRWISPWTYRRLLNQEVFEDQENGVRPAANASFKPLTILTAILEPDGSISDASVMELTTRSEPLGIKLPGYTAELVDAKGRVIRKAPVWADPLQGDSWIPAGAKPQCPCIIEALLPDAPGDAYIRVRAGAREVLKLRTAAATGAPVQLLAAPGVGGVRLSWSGIQAGDEVWLRVSKDGGKSWAMLDVGNYPSGNYDVGRDRLPSSGSVIFELLSAERGGTRRAVTQALSLAATK